MPATVAVQVRLAVPEPVTLAGVIVPQLSPVGTVSLRVTVPANPFRPVTVMVDVSEDLTTAAVGVVAATVKSTKLKVAVAVCDVEPLMPATVSM